MATVTGGDGDDPVRHPARRSGRLLDALGAGSGIVCAVGAGGKKSVLGQLAREHPGRTALTATVYTTFPADLSVTGIIDEEALLPQRVMAAARGRSVAYACPSTKNGRHSGVSPGTIRSIHQQGGFEATLVKADGARMRWIKAPAEREPVLVPGADLVIPVVSARAIGEPLGERVAHRVARVAAAAGLDSGATLTPDAVARLLASADGGLRGVGDARVVPVINMVDDAGREALARDTACAALAITDRFDRVVLCCLRRPDAPVVLIVNR